MGCQLFTSGVSGDFVNQPNTCGLRELPRIAAFGPQSAFSHLKFIRLCSKAGVDFAQMIHTFETLACKAAPVKRAQFELLISSLADAQNKLALLSETANVRMPQSPSPVCCY